MDTTSNNRALPFCDVIQREEQSLFNAGKSSTKTQKEAPIPYLVSKRPLTLLTNIGRVPSRVKGVEPGRENVGPAVFIPIFTGANGRASVADVI